ncbi:MAG: electron transport complex subunit RsxE [Spirochaetales bacterium]|nr:electron transport complex subunit RsxE [Leptospiraceae bacterium]MCP5481516.1 electron transport complex subunit RsxE [Spirochaetales bacterium]MCP5484344.1 electron transport complex subunit RsxE [Spirochaetales bacterium]
MSGSTGKEAAFVFDDYLKGLARENPVFVQALGMCPVLAVSNSVINALVMGLATMAVLLVSSLFVSIIRKAVPAAVRISTYILIIASFVTVADYSIQAISLPVHQALGAYIPLIVVNCIILGRAEAFASRHTPLRAAMDALGMGSGFTVAIVAIGSLRELLGSGSLFQYRLLPASYAGWNIMILPGGAFFALAALLMLWNFLRTRNKSSRTAEAQP